MLLILKAERVKLSVKWSGVRLKPLTLLHRAWRHRLGSGIVSPSHIRGYKHWSMYASFKSLCVSISR